VPGLRGALHRLTFALEPGMRHNAAMGAPIRQIDRFAEMLAESEGTRDDGNVGIIARRLGLHKASGNGMLQRLRRDLGWQAK
jgi:hypothetical protein